MGHFLPGGVLVVWRNCSKIGPSCRACYYHEIDGLSDEEEEEEDFDEDEMDDEEASDRAGSPWQGARGDA